MLLKKTDEAKVLSELADLGIEDVYFNKGKLFIVNDYDVDAVDRFLDRSRWGLMVEWVYDEEVSSYTYL